MSNDDPTIRCTLPQQSQMNSFSFTPQQYTQGETQRNYVFIAERNRNKRLKVMRACENCRRRKVRCDAVTNNTRPCSACVRLKLACVCSSGAKDPTAYGTATVNPSDHQQQITKQHQMSTGAKLSPATMCDTQQRYHGPNAAYQHVQCDTAQQPGMLYDAIAPPVHMMKQSYSAQYGSFTLPMYQPSASPAAQQQPSPVAYAPGKYQHYDLTNLLGTFKINDTGTAPYLRNEALFRRREQPAIEDDADEFPLDLPMLASGHNIRIPPELMPDEDTALNYFDLYFTHVHPYVPVLCKSALYQQWNTDRNTISTLILDAIFAIGGQLAGEPGESQRWLALASSHADYFMDVPRLSTLQALLMILKAREAVPRRGYYYRSWMTVVQCVQMGKDLGLDEHYGDHQAGISCEFTPVECQLRKRLWQLVFVCEVMIGAPQGRHDHAVKINTVDFTVARPVPGCEESEYHISRNFSYFSQVVRTVASMSKVYTRLRRQRDWGVDPEFQQLGQSLNTWLTELPRDLAISFPSDGSPTWIPSHFIGNMHGYYYLAMIHFHRPILSFLDHNSPDGQWKRHMMICYSSAKALCNLQEATLNSFGLTGLQCMQRGFSFSLYVGLSCIAIHLVAIVSPDPELNGDAREYLTRHMRVLEKVMEVWPMPELENQINTLRDAFSADVQKPFVLKPSFPYGTPHPSTHSSPPRGNDSFQPVIHRTGSIEQHLDIHGARQVSYTNHPITPPISAGPLVSKSESPAVQSLVMMSQGSQAPGMPQAMSLTDQPA